MPELFRDVGDFRSEADAIERLAANEIWRERSSHKPAGGTLTPFSVEWFRHLEYKRYRRQGRWIPALLDITRHRGESLLALGDSLGTEWVRYAEAGTNVTICDPVAQRLRLLKHHFGVRGLSASLVHAPYNQLPLGSERHDVVCLFFHQAPAVDWQLIIDEALRVLRPGGKLIAVLPALRNAVRWQRSLLPWRWWQRSTSEGRYFAGTELHAFLQRFENIRVFKRHLRRSELPYGWRWLPLPLMERMMGRFLIAKAFKPVQLTRSLRAVA